MKPINLKGFKVISVIKTDTKQDGVENVVYRYSLNHEKTTTTILIKSPEPLDLPQATKGIVVQLTGFQKTLI